MTSFSTGPLAGTRVVEFAGIGPGPHCAMLLANLGAEILRLDRPAGGRTLNPVVDRGKATLAIDLKTDAGRNQALSILDRADVLIEGFRPGVMERLGLGPHVVCERNARLIYGRMTGWGQDGPLARRAGHDINYIAVTGALAPIGPAGRPPTPPLNLVGDFGGGSLYLALGIVAALVERERSGRGQVIDAAIVDGVASLMAMFEGLAATTQSVPATELLGGAAPFYRCYTCKDGKAIAVGALEPEFYGQLLALIGAPADFVNDQRDASTWESRRTILSAIFAERTRDEWCALLESTDACVAPVLTLDEAREHPHAVARGTYVSDDGVVQAIAAPRFSRTVSASGPAPRADDLLARWGV